MFSYIGIILATLEMHATSSKRLSYIANTIVHAKKTCAKYIAMVFSLVNSSATLKPISATKTSNLIFNIGADELRLCMRYANLSAFFTQMFNFVNMRQKRNMRIIHQIMHFPVFRCFYPRFLGSVGILPTLGEGYAPIYMKTRGLRTSECYLHFSMHFAVFG